MSIIILIYMTICFIIKRACSYAERFIVILCIAHPIRFTSDFYNVILSLDISQKEVSIIVNLL